MSVAIELPSIDLDRHSHKATAPLVWAIGLAMALFHIYFNTIDTIADNWLTAAHFGGFGCLCVLLYPSWHGESTRSRRWALLVDFSLAMAIALSAGYLIVYESSLYERGVQFDQWDWLFSAMAVLLAIECVRRTIGWFIPFLIIVTLTYVVWWGKYIDGVFAFPGLNLETVLFRSYFGGEGMFGTIAYISATYVFMFILFGAFLVHSGGGNFLVDLARCTAGRFTGGPGMVAVVGSGLMGSVSGSAVANTCSTGVITIPMMKKAGFPGRLAAGIEAASSTGGQLMPPVMGAGAFILANYTQVSYLKILAVSTLPALLYFISVMYYVRIEAKRLGLHNQLEAVPSVSGVLKEGWHFIIPLLVLVAVLWAGYTPTYAAGAGILAVIGASWLSSNPMKLHDICQSMVDGSKNMITTAVLLIAIGLVVNVVTTVGIGNTMSLMISNWAHGSLLLTLCYVAIASLILGMGLPVTASYIVLGTLSAPVIYDLLIQSYLVEMLVSGTIPDALSATLQMIAPEHAGLLAGAMDEAAAEQLLASIPKDFMSIVVEQSISPEALTGALLTAHLIIFWLSQDSNVTPPVCLTAFSAAAIAGSKPMATGVTAWRIAKGLYIIPLLFAYTPFVSGDFQQSLLVFITAAFGLYALTGAMQGYLEGPLNYSMRAVLVLAAALLLWPNISALLTILGGVITVTVWFRSKLYPHPTTSW